VQAPLIGNIAIVVEGEESTMDQHLSFIHHIAGKAMMGIISSSVAIGIHLNPGERRQCQDVDIIESSASFLFASSSIEVTETLLSEQISHFRSMDSHVV
jgi:predicted metal-dependent TIM-barrel fold hydrolase